jgi:ferredoxin
MHPINEFPASRLPAVPLRRMANSNIKVRRNVAGVYYVDESCIDCDMCRSIAPQFFTRDDSSGFSYVHQQPSTPNESSIAEDARLGCPTESIGNDGV